MKIERLTEGKAMRFKIKECEKDYLSLATNKPSSYVFDVRSEEDLESAFSHIQNILTANGYDSSKIICVGKEKILQ